MTEPTVISTTPSGTEICYSLGFEPAAVSHRCDFPPAARDRPVITSHGADGYAMDTDLLNELEPDAIVTQDVCGTCAVDEPLVQSALSDVAARPEVISLAPARLEDIPEGVKRLGEALGRAERASRVVEQFLATIDQFGSVTKSAPGRPRAVVLEWLDPLRVAGKWVPDLVGAAGGRMLLSSAGERSQQISYDELLKARPDVIVLAPCGFDPEQTEAAAKDLRDRSDWRELPAVRQDLVYTFDGRILSRWTPRLAGEIERLAATFHPSLLGGPPVAP